MKVKNSDLVLLLLSIVPRLGASTDRITTEFENEYPNVVSCLTDIIKSLQVRKMSIFCDADNSSLMESIFRSVDAPVLINCMEQPKKGLDTRIENDLVIMIEKNMEVIALLNNVLWHGETRFILVFDGELNTEIFQHFWREKVINVFYVCVQEDEVLLYTFLPYGTENCDEVNPIILDKCSNRKFLNGGILRIRDEVGIMDMNQCPVNVTIVNVRPQVFFEDDCSCNGSRRISGIEGNLMNEIAKKFNMDVTYVIALDGIGWGWINPVPHGVVGEVYTGRSDFGIGLLAPTIERFESLDLSTPYDGPECITYGVPKGAGEKKPTWITILTFEFEVIMWLLIVLVFVVVLTCCSFINDALKLSLFPNKFDEFMYLLGSCLGTPVNIQSSVTLRIAVISWIFFTFVLTVAYKSSMGSKLTVPTPDPDINTFKELLKSQLKLTGYNNMLRLMQYNDSDPDIKLMADRFIITNFDIDAAIDAIAKYREIAHVRHASTFLYYSLINAEARGHIHLLKSCIYHYYPMFVMKKRSPFTKRTNQIIHRLNEGGIIQYWTSAYIYQLPDKGNTFEKLSVRHTFGMFFIIILGYCSASLVFVFELSYRHFSSLRKKLFSKIAKSVSPRKRTTNTLFSLKNKSDVSYRGTSIILPQGEAHHVPIQVKFKTVGDSQ